METVFGFEFSLCLCIRDTLQGQDKLGTLLSTYFFGLLPFVMKVAKSRDMKRHLITEAILM